MIELGSTNNVRAAQGFIDYLSTQGLHGELKPAQQGHVIIAVDPEHFHAVQPLWNEFKTEPNHPRYSDAAWQSGRTDSGLVYSGNKLNLWQRFNGLSLLVKSVSIISVIIYALFLLGQFSHIFPLLQFKASQPLSWITPAVVHFSAIHLIFNVLWWLTLGPAIERQTSKLTLLSVFLLGSLASAWAQYTMVGPNFGGLSGVVYAQVGFCWIYPLLAKTKPMMTKAMIGFLLLWLVFGFTDTFFMPMANWAHLGGLVSGIVLALVMAFGSNKKAA
ncbi:MULTISPECIES: rhomboid family intramembrane serine protease GlpG [Pseudoalteromonas]|uniref:GlpG protein n=1 Tax=Pseudoalteromonas ruthenica TaxID=151081 RepID=A0A0F4PW50_9GAMM|nr:MULTISPECIES: rhomboid family intramembrane serine protease GlpG [Pseudoalteromonas]KJY96635.1 GlpG protein [Pseudoalteromonas ruthenica]KJY98506.1 GlpG protein [Pseudoalteromonas ruthenica]MCG7543499.1 rhomboid family intramembrane serine protease GlpG [Pseudoalteromonas sp. MM17-2]QFU03979.1 Rhomboid protease GlpG [Pseudoalteromonas sp. THAF3]RZF77721.1 rhomboid family intramembrane serine protease GlpG [Pseudoalteromonas sp. CO325X]